MNQVGDVPTVVDGNARFQVLSPRLIRLEYAPEGDFENRSTFFARNREPSPAEATTRVENGWRVIETSKTQVRYLRQSGPFDSSNVEVRVVVEGDTTTGRPTWPTRPTCGPGQVCQAEDGVQRGGVARNSSYAWYTGPGYVEHLASGSVEWPLDKTLPDSAEVGVRYATPSPNTIHLSGQDFDRSLSLPTTDGWDDWAIARATIPSDQSRIRLECSDCEVHVDYLAVGKQGRSLPSPDPGRTSPLSGWRHGLGNRSGDISFYPGIVRRKGWTLHDDSRTAVTRKDTAWVTPRKRPSTYRDGYVFGYGHDYAQALQDKAHLSGAPPLLPRWAFGVWYSRLFPHTADDYRKSIMPKARERDLPLSVLVLDTDVKAPNRWRGWDWEDDLIPWPDSFFTWSERQNLQVALNIHPSIGTEDPRYPVAQRVADSTLIDIRGKCPRWQGDTGTCAGWDWGKPSHTASYMAVHEPLQEQGVDIWWLDWCCDASRVSMPGLTPDTWINEQYARKRRGRNRRGFVLSRIGSSWQSPGSARPGAWATHRSAVHFTGDTNPTWEMLDFQSEFTMREGMMGIPYVSHDIGSFHGGGPRADSISGNMYVRWVQFGTFQPIFRLHGHGPRLPWQRASRPDSLASRFMRLRGSLVPHLYSLARAAHDTGLPMVRGLPLEYPSQVQAYRHESQYLLGSQLLVAPVAKPGSYPEKAVWFPPGTWIDWFTGEKYRGPTIDTLSVPLDQMPVFLRAGSIIPLQPPSPGRQDLKGPLRLRIAAGNGAERSIYHDRGIGVAYRNGAYAKQQVSWNDSARALQIGAVKTGKYSGQPSKRAYQVSVENVDRPTQVAESRPSHDLQEVPVEWTYDKAERRLTFEVPPLPVDVPSRIMIRHGSGARRPEHSF